MLRLLARNIYFWFRRTIADFDDTPQRKVPETYEHTIASSEFAEQCSHAATFEFHDGAAADASRF